MSTRIIRCVRRAGVALQRQSFTLYTTPRAVPLQPFLPRTGVLQPRNFGFSRLLSSTGKLSKQTENTSGGWVVQGVPDVGKWNERMDELAERSRTDLNVINEWAELLEEGVAAKLPDIEITLMRHREISPNLDMYMDQVLAEDDNRFDEDDEDDEDDIEFDDEDEDEDGDGDEDEFSDEELAEVLRNGGQLGGSRAGITKGGETIEVEHMREGEEEEEHKLEEVAREELANELEREQGGGKDSKGQKGRKI